MGKVTILSETTLDPISKIGRRAGICYGADVTDPEKNYRRGLDCIESGHGRALEFVDIEMVLDGYSARVIREWYTHIGCAPTRLQSSTRYIDYCNFDYVVPPKVRAGSDASYEFCQAINDIKEHMCDLVDAGVPREDVAMLLPLCMKTTIVDKRNLRNLIDMSRQRMCQRANWEFRQLFEDVCHALSMMSKEWEYVIETQMMPKCEYIGYRPEKKGCGRKAPKPAVNAPAAVPDPPTTGSNIKFHNEPSTDEIEKWYEAHKDRIFRDLVTSPPVLYQGLVNPPPWQITCQTAATHSDPNDRSVTIRANAEVQNDRKD